MNNINTVLHTDGSGYWSTHSGAVRVIGVELAYVDESANFGELCVYFDEDTWDTDVLGLIYTDRQFKSELAEMLAAQGINGEFSYSEQGMQGENYVSFDVGSTFIAQWQGRVSH